MIVMFVFVQILDEVLKSGWRAIIESYWKTDTKRGHYRYRWSFNEDGSEESVFDYEKVHLDMIISGYIQFMKF